MFMRRIILCSEINLCPESMSDNRVTGEETALPVESGISDWPFIVDNFPNMTVVCFGAVWTAESVGELWWLIQSQYLRQISGKDRTV